MTSLTQILTLVSAATVAGIVSNHHIREMNQASPELLAPVVRTAAPAAERTVEDFLAQIHLEVEARKAAGDGDEGVLVGPLGMLPATADDELDYATQRWHQRLEAARRAAELAPPPRAAGHRRASASNPRIKHAKRRPTSKGVRSALRRKGRGGAGGSIFERSRGYATHGSSFPLKRRIGGSSSRRSRSGSRGTTSSR